MSRLSRLLLLLGKEAESLLGIFLKVLKVKGLKPSGKVLFHTAPAGNLPSLIENGLYGHRTDPNISMNLGYSLFFPYEHAISRKNGSPTFSKDEINARTTTPENYILTIWRPNAEVRRRKEWGRLGFLVVKGDPQGSVPAEFYRSSLHGSYIQEQPELIGKVGPEKLLGAIPLNRVVRDEILKLMVLAAKGRIGADQIEVELLQKLNQEKGVALFERGLTLPTLAHLLTNSIERELVRCVVLPAVEHSKTDTELYLDDWSKEYRGYPLKALWLVMKYRANVNDTATARYLDGVAKVICRRIQKQGVKATDFVKKFKANIDLLKKGKGVEPEFEYYNDGSDVSYFYGGSTPSLNAASSMEKELGFE